VGDRADPTSFSAIFARLCLTSTPYKRLLRGVLGLQRRPTSCLRRCCLASVFTQQRIWDRRCNPRWRTKRVFHITRPTIVCSQSAEEMSSSATIETPCSSNGSPPVGVTQSRGTGNKYC
jgi:hypothetical protein